MKYISNLFKGRINRRNWALGLLTSVTLFFLVAISTGYASSEENLFISILYLVFFVSFLVFNISLHIRRFHDLGKSGWSVILMLVPVLNIIIFINLAAGKGQPDKNEYGEKPAEKISYPKDILGIS